MKPKQYKFTIPVSKLRLYRAYAKSKGIDLASLIRETLEAETGVQSQKQGIADELYNPDLKLQFLKTAESESSRRSIVAIFRKTEPLEQMTETDVSLWGEPDLIRFFATLETYGIKRSAIWVIRQYVSWLRKTGQPYSDAVMFIQIQKP